MTAQARLPPPPLPPGPPPAWAGGPGLPPPQQHAPGGCARGGASCVRARSSPHSSYGRAAPCPPPACPCLPHFVGGLPQPMLSTQRSPAGGSAEADGTAAAAPGPAPSAAAAGPPPGAVAAAAVACCCCCWPSSAVPLGARLSILHVEGFAPRPAKGEACPAAAAALGASAAAAALDPAADAALNSGPRLGGPDAAAGVLAAAGRNSGPSPAPAAAAAVAGLGGARGEGLLTGSGCACLLLLLSSSLLEVASLGSLGDVPSWPVGRGCSCCAIAWPAGWTSGPSPGAGPAGSTGSGSAAAAAAACWGPLRSRRQHSVCAPGPPARPGNHSCR